MSNQPTSRPEPEALHRSMMQACLRHAALDRRVEEERRRDGLGPFLQPWRDAAAGLRAALGKARADLQRHGTAREHLERIERRLEHLQRRAAAFDVHADLDECAASWGHLAHEVAGLSGPRRDELLRFLAARKDAIDRGTAGLSQARKAGGVHPEQRARLRVAEDERERAREQSARLRDDYLRAARGHGTPHPPGALAPVVVTLPELLAPRGALRSGSPPLDAVIERDRHLRVGVAQRFEKTLGSLATAGHRTLTDPRAGELRGHLARMDGILARLQGKRSASELSDGAREVGGLLARMGDLASAPGSDAAVKPFRALLEERRAALARLAGEAQKAAGAQALHQPGALPQPSAMALGEKQLHTLRKLHPGIEALLRDASASHLAAELRRPEVHSPLQRAQGRLGPTGLACVGQAIAGAHLGGLGAGPAQPQARELLGTLRKAPPGSPLHRIATNAEERRRQIAERAKARLHGRGPAHGAARALGDALQAHGRTDFAAHVAPGGALYHLLQGAQRSHGLPVPHFASHFLQSRGAHPLAGTLQLFDHLRAKGYRPHFGLFNRLKHAAGDAFHEATSAIAHTAADAARTASGLAKAAGGAVRGGLSDLGRQALDRGQGVAATVRGAAGKVGRTVARGVGSGARSLSQALQHGAQFVGREPSALGRATGRAVTRVTRTVRDVVHGGIDRVTQLGAAVMQRAGEAGRQVSRFGARALHTGLDALHRTGIAGGIGRGVRFGLSMVKAAAKYSPVGLALQGFHKAGGLQGIWEKTKHTAGAAWQGVQKAYRATAGFLQSPAGQLLVTGLSLAATFVPGGVVVKSIVGGAIGAIQAVSEGKDLKRVLLAAGTGALTGALPFLKLGPLAGMGIGALTGAATALASGGSLKDAVKGAGAGALDSFDPGALKALGRLKGLKGAQKVMGHGASDKMQRYRGYLDKGLGYAGVREGVPGVHPEGAPKQRKKIHDAPELEHLQGGRPAAHAEVAHESDEERSRRLTQAWNVYRNTRAIFAVQGKVISFAGALGDADARPHVDKVLAEARAAKAELRSLQAKYKRDGGARDFLGDSAQDRLIDESIAKLEKALQRGGKSEPKAAHAPETAGLRKSAEHGLAKIQRLQKHADQVRDSVDEGHHKLHGAMQVAARGKKGLHEGRKLLEEALHLGAQRHVEKGHRERPRDADGPVPPGHPDESEREHVPGLDRAGLDGAHLAADAHVAVQAAAHAVAHFGAALDGAVKAVQRLLERDRGAEAADRIRSVEQLGDEAAAAVKDAARAASNDPGLADRVAKLRDNLQEMRARFRQLVSGLSGLASKDGALDGERPGQRDGHPRHRPGGRRGRRPQGDLVDEVLRGIDDGRVFADRGAHRGELPEHDGQEVDSAAIDTWLGSGEGVKLFSDVFGAFLPAEGSARRGPRHRGHGGHGSRGGHDHGGHAPHDQERPGRRGGKGGFFAKVFEKVEDFAESVAHAAHGGARLLGKAMHYAEMGMHGLNVVEHAAERVHDLAGKAEGFLSRVHLGSAAGFAQKVGAAAGWVDARAEEAHGGLETAGEALGEGKHDLEAVESFGHRTAKVARKGRKGELGDLLHLFRAATDGDGTDGRLRPEQVRLGSTLDEPRRLDALTQARMERFLGGDFTGVRVHVGPGAAQITSRYAAEAVTVRDHIFFAPGKFSPGSVEGEKLLAHELTHVLQKGRKNLDVRTAEAEALHAEHSYGSAPAMETLNLSRPAPDFKLPDGEGAPASDGIHTAKRTRSRGHDAAGKDDLPDGEEFLEKVSGRVYDLLMDELEQSFESR